MTMVIPEIEGKLKHRENLWFLSFYLRGGELKSEFYMSFYSANNGDGVGMTNCGSIGCAVGHGPFAHPDLKKEFSETWNDYCLRVFGIHHGSKEWHWCFAGEWQHYDSTPMGAGRRIAYMLDNGVPETFTPRDPYDDTSDGNYGEFLSLYGGGEVA